MINLFRFIAVLFFVALTRLLLLYFFPLHLTDYHLIQTAAGNLIDGQGMGFQRSSVEDLSSFYFEGLRLWPPLVTLLTALFNSITGNQDLADLLLMSFSMLGFLWALYRLSKTIGLNKDWRLILFLFLGLNPEVIKQPGFSDLVSALFCVWALLETAEWVKNGNKKSLSKLLILSFLFFLPSAFRYQYYPISLLFPTYLLTYGLTMKSKAFVRASFCCFALVIAFLFAQEFLLYLYTGQPLNQSVAMDDTGLFFYNLKEFYPFFPKAFLNTSYFENIWQYSLHQYRYTYFLISLLLFVGWIFFLLHKSKDDCTEQNTQPKQKTQHQVISLVVTVLLVSLFILIGLSITHNSRSGVPGGWTYLIEGRYFIVPTVLVLLLSIWKLQQQYLKRSYKSRKFIKSVLFLILLFNALLTIKLYYNIATGNIPSQKRKGESEREMIEKFLKQKASTSNIPLVISTNDPSLAFFSYHQNIAVTEAIETLSAKTIHSRKHVNLHIIIRKNQSIQEQAFLAASAAREVYQTEHFIVYSLQVNPNLKP